MSQLIKMEEEYQKREDEREKRWLALEEKKMEAEERREQQMFSMFMGVLSQIGSRHVTPSPYGYTYPPPTDCGSYYSGPSTNDKDYANI